MPKSTQNLNTASNSRGVPYKSDLNLRSKKINDENSRTNVGAQNPSKIVDPMDPSIVLKAYMKHHKASIEAIKKENGDLNEKVQKSNMTIAEKNQEIAELKKHVENYERQLEELTKQNGEHEETIRDLESKYSAVHEKYVTLEVGYDRHLTSLNLEKRTLKFELDEQQKFNMELQRTQLKLESDRQGIIEHFENLLRHKENRIASKEADFIKIQHLNDEAKKAIDTEKKANEVQVAAIRKSTEKEKQLMRDEIEKQANIIAEHLKKRADYKNKIEAALSQLKESEMRYDQLNELNTKLTNEAVDVKLKLETKIKQQKMQIDMYENMKKEAIVAANTQKERHQNEIDALKQANEEITLKMSTVEMEAQQEIEKRDDIITEMTIKCNDLEQDLANSNKRLSDENDIAQKVVEIQKRHEERVLAYELVIKNMEANGASCKNQYSEMERAKNATIAELRYKIKQIGNAFGQQVGTASILPNTNHDNDQPLVENELQSRPSTSGTIQPTAKSAIVVPENPKDSIETVAASVPTSQVATRKRRHPARRPVYQEYNSDFNTDSDDNNQDPNWKTRQPKSKMHRSNDTNTPRNSWDEVFNKLKST